MILVWHRKPQSLRFLYTDLVIDTKSEFCTITCSQTKQQLVQEIRPPGLCVSCYTLSRVMHWIFKVSHFMTALPGIAGLFLQLVQPVTGYLSGTCLILQNSHSPLYFTFRKCLKIFSYDGLKGPICNEQTVNNCVGPCAFAHSSKQYLMNSALRKLSMLSRFK